MSTANRMYLIGYGLLIGALAIIVPETPLQWLGGGVAALLVLAGIGGMDYE